MSRPRERMADGLMAPVGEMATVGAGAVEGGQEHDMYGQPLGGGDVANALPEAGVADIGRCARRLALAV